ncbi:DUF6968 family protein [Xanthomonas campestris]|jgi:hypothetical protein|uniref:DUF6968 family protein n=1 Tax=Xanthomonas campestris TaxID=339 RepID=UPI000E0F372A|nr:hypothetical protein [Xanthomonas campestris]
MTSIPIGEVFVQRELEFHTPDGLAHAVLVHVGRPVQEADGPWLCPYLIEAPSFRRQFRIAGEDSMQSLILALRTVAVELEVLAKDNSGSFTWFGDSDLGLA